MTGQPLPPVAPLGVGPDDPVEILRRLPAQYHQHFLAEYEAAITGPGPRRRRHAGGAGHPDDARS
jgi:hypothetical protein